MTPVNRFDESLLLRVLSDFAATLARRYDITDVLFQVAERVVEILDLVGTGVSLADQQGLLHPVTPINELTRLLELVEEHHQEGPCIDAFHKGELVVVRRVADEKDRWPAWCQEAERQGVGAVLGIPLTFDDKVLGAVNVYSGEERDWQPSEISVARTLVDMAASYVAHASELADVQRINEQLNEALESRVVIEQAKGIVAAERQISVDDAFVLLRTHARGHGATLRAVSEAVVTLGLRPGGDRPKT